MENKMNLIFKLFNTVILIALNTLFIYSNQDNTISKKLYTDKYIPYVDPRILLSPFKDGFVLKVNKHHKMSIVPYSYEHKQFLAYSVIKIPKRNGEQDKNAIPTILYSDEYSYENIVPYDKTNWVNNGVGLFIRNTDNDITINYHLKGYKPEYHSNQMEYIQGHKYISRYSTFFTNIKHAYIQIKLNFSDGNSANTPILALITYKHNYVGSKFYMYMNNVIYEGIFPNEHYSIVYVKKVLNKDFRSFN